MQTKSHPSRLKRPIAALAFAFAIVALIPASQVGATSIDALKAKVETARKQASGIAAELQAKQAQLGTAQQQAADAAAREQDLTTLLAAGKQRSAELARKVSRAEHQLTVDQRRLRRARRILAHRLVAIYESPSPDMADLAVTSKGFSDLVTRSNYLRAIQAADAGLTVRVRKVRNSVRRLVADVKRAKDRADAYNARLASARIKISAVRAQSEQVAAHLAAISASKQSSLSTLKSHIGGWVKDVEAAQAAARKKAAEAAAADAAAAAAAQAQVGRWLGGPYSIPTYIVMCESGGDYSAVNPSSGAGGAYQILPSTWALYGGTGNPEDGSKAEQDRIAAEIWADSGPSAWVCG